MGRVNRVAVLIFWYPNLFYPSRTKNFLLCKWDFIYTIIIYSQAMFNCSWLAFRQRSSDTSSDRKLYEVCSVVLTTYSILQVSLLKIIYLNCRERRSNDKNDHCSYVQNLSSCEIVIKTKTMLATMLSIPVSSI